MLEHSSYLEQGRRKGVEQKGSCLLYLEGSINANLSVETFILVCVSVDAQTHPHAGCQKRRVCGGGEQGVYCWHQMLMHLAPTPKNSLFPLFSHYHFHL